MIKVGQFNSRVYGSLGFTPEDGEGVRYSLAEVEDIIRDKHFYGNGSKRVIKNYLYERDHATCKYCKCYLHYKEAIIDHFYPAEFFHISEKNICDGIGNLVLACRTCNFLKGKKSPESWVVYNRKNLSKKIKLKKLIKRTKTRIILTLKGTRTLSGKHRGIERYRKMTIQERDEARDARFRQDY